MIYDIYIFLNVWSVPGVFCTNDTINSNVEGRVSILHVSIYIKVCVHKKQRNHKKLLLQVAEQH